MLPRCALGSWKTHTTHMNALRTFTATQHEALNEAVKEGSSDYLFYKWLEHSTDDMHQQLFLVWRDPKLIFLQGTDGPYGMKTLERTRQQFDMYVASKINDTPPG